MKANILIVDDERPIRETLEMVLKEEGYEVQMAGDGREALQLLKQIDFQIMISDIKMPEMGGIELLKECQKICPQTSVILITAYGSLETAIEALRLGAYDYILKPFDFDHVLLKIKRLIKYRELALDNQKLQSLLNEQYNFDNIIGQSEEMKQVFRLIEKVARTRGNVLITGKSGTGKELVARAIHHNSDRSSKSFVPINCGAVVGTLMESEFFGHKKGSFTGAVRDKDGHFQMADGGTLFLDEVGDIPLHLQVKLLRAIEESEVLPVGGSAPVKVDVRIIAATNKNLIKEVEQGAFRDDLYYRLNVVEIKLPSLNERREDIPLLVQHFIEKYNRAMNRKIKNVDNETMRLLMNYSWKGGIRELENVIERAIILCDNDYISRLDLPPNLAELEADDEIPNRMKDAVSAFERKHIRKILRMTANNKEEAANILEISLSSLYRKIDELRIK